MGNRPPVRPGPARPGAGAGAAGRPRPARMARPQPGRPNAARGRPIVHEPEGLSPTVKIVVASVVVLVILALAFAAMLLLDEGLRTSLFGPPSAPPAPAP